jgi:hypothetical protein
MEVLLPAQRQAAHDAQTAFHRWENAWTVTLHAMDLVVDCLQVCILTAALLVNNAALWRN